MNSSLNYRCNDVRKLLDVYAIKPFLLQSDLLTWEESQKLTVLSRQSTKSELADEVLGYVVRKGRNHESLFLEALKKSMESEGNHLGHKELITILEKDLNNKDEPLGKNSLQGDKDGAYVFQKRGAPTLPTAKSPTTPNPMSQVTGMLSPSLQAASAVAPVGEILQSKATGALGQFDELSQTGLNWRQLEELKCQIVKDSRAIMAKYVRLVLQVYRLLQRLNVEFECVQIALLHLGCSQRLPGSPFLFNETSEIAQAKSIHELVGSLHSYSSWFNYELIKFLATEEGLGGEEGEVLIREYEADLKEFCQKYIFACPQFTIGSQTPTDFEEFQMKVNWDYASCLAQDVAIFKTTVSELLDIKPYALQLKSVEEGCVLMTWQAPSSIILQIPDKVLNAYAELSKLNVTRVSVVGKEIEIPKKESYSPQYRSVSKSPHPLWRISEASSTGASSIDLTDMSSQRNSGISILSIGSAPTQISLKELCCETTSVQEEEILSLYSGEAYSPQSPPGPNADYLTEVKRRLSTSEIQLPLVSNLDIHSRNRFKSESDISAINNSQSCKTKRFRKRRLLTAETRPTSPSQNFMGSLKNLFFRLVRRRRSSPLLSTEHNLKIRSPAKERLPILQLEGEPVVSSPIPDTRVVYFNSPKSTAVKTKVESSSEQHHSRKSSSLSGTGSDDLHSIHSHCDQVYRTKPKSFHLSQCSEMIYLLKVDDSTSLASHVSHLTHSQSETFCTRVGSPSCTSDYSSGYESLSRKTSLSSLAQSMSQDGVDEDGRPLRRTKSINYRSRNLCNQFNPGADHRERSFSFNK